MVPDASRCVQCGICSYNCPMAIDVRAYSCFGCHKHDRGKKDGTERWNASIVRSESQTSVNASTATQLAANIAIHPPKTELLTQRAPSVATGKAIDAIA